MGTTNFDRVEVNAGFTVTGADTSITDGGVFKCGTSSVPIVADVADMKFIGIYVDNGATSGDNRGMYLRQYTTGAGGGGEAGRIFHSISNVAAGTAHGAHISLGFATSGSITGLGVANRCTLHTSNTALSGGTYASVQAEIWADGDSADVSGATEYSLLRCVLGGDATGLANVDDNAFLLTLSGGAIASGNIAAAKTSAAVSHTLKINLYGTTYYLMVSDTQ
jgi:hypothetical protein